MKRTILILVTNPKNTSTLDLLPEINNLEEAIQRSLNKDYYEVKWKVAVQEKDLRRHILDLKPSIIHYCGHATKEGLLLHDENHKPKLLGNEFIVDLLKEFKNRLECVVLNACETETLAELLANDLNYAVGMKLEVKDRAAVVFAEGFYDALGARESIDTAFNIGKNAVLGLKVVGNVTKRKAVYDDYHLLKNDPIPDHLIPVIKKNPEQQELVDEFWLTPTEEKEAIDQLLTAIENSHNKIKLFHTPEEVTLKDQYIPIQVTLERRYKDKLETTWSYTESEEELKQVYALKGFSGEQLEEEIRKTQEDWHTAKQKEPRIMVLADPGMGKSTLLRMEVFQAVKQAKDDLEAGKEINSLTIPLFVRLSSLVDNNVIDLPLEDAILEIMQTAYSAVLKELKFLTEDKNANAINFLKDFLKEQLLNGKCLLLLDALDEVPQEKRHILLNKLNTFVDNYPDCRIVATSRIVVYGGEFNKHSKEMEIIPFDHQKTKEYIKRWFFNAEKHLQDNSVTPQGLIQALKERPQLSGLAQNPLLLSLICSLYQQDKLTLPVRKGEIYQQAVNYMLEDWSIDNERESTDEARIETKKDILTELAYEFSDEGTQVFSSRTLKKKIKDYLKRDNTTNLHTEANYLITELSDQDGILQKLNPDKSEYIFLHRTFQEYFTALYLKYRIEDDQETGIELVKKYLWNYDWHEILTVLAGLMKQPIVLIKAIRTTRDDIFQTQLLLAGRCIAECDEISNPLIDETIDHIYKFWLKYKDCEFIRSVVVLLAKIYDKLVSTLIYELKTDKRNWYKYNFVAKSLGEIGNDKGVDALFESLTDKEASLNIFAAKSLGKLGNDKAVDALIHALTDEDYKLRLKAAEALGESGNDNAVDALIHALTDGDSKVRLCAVEALGKLGNDKAVDALIHALTDEDYELRLKAAEALGESGNDKGVVAIFESLADNDSKVRLCAVEALKRLSNNKAADNLFDKWVDIFIDLLQDDLLENRVFGAALLAIFPNDKAVDALISALTDGDSEVRLCAAEALGKLGNDKAVDALISALTDGDSKVRFNTIEALGKLGNDKAVAPLISTLLDKNSRLSSYAAKALGNIGNDEAVDVLSKVYTNQQYWHYDDFRKHPIEALGNSGNDRAVDALISALQDNLKIQYLAAQGLAKIGSPACCEKLFQSVPLKFIYQGDIFPVARNLAIRYSKTPVFPELFVEAETTDKTDKDENDLHKKTIPSNEFIFGRILKKIIDALGFSAK